MAFVFSDGYVNTIYATGFPFVAGDIVELRNGTQPAIANTAPTGSVIRTVTIPASGTVAISRGYSKNGTWSANDAVAGTPTWFRVKKSGDLGTTNTTDKRIDGSVSLTGGGGDMTVDNTTLTSGQVLTVNTWQVTS